MIDRKILLLSALCVSILFSCGDKKAEDEVSVSETFMTTTTEISTTATQVQTTTETVATTTATVATTDETADIEIPENAVYEQTVTSYGEYGFYDRNVNIFDKDDNILINVEYRSENGEPNRKVLYTYDADGNIIKEDFYFDNRLSDYIEYEYNENGIMISDTEYDILNNDEVHEIKTDYIYDDKGRLSAEQAYQNDRESWRIEYEYDEQDRLVKENFYSRINSYFSYTYDENGNLAERTSDGEFGVTVTYYAYDENNRLVKSEDYHDGEWLYTYEYEYEFY